MAVAVLFTASCAKEDISSSIGGGEVEMTFTVDLPELGTRANTYGNGANATLLRYYVFDAANGAELEALRGTATRTSGNFTFTLPLLKGMKYHIALWADKNIGTADVPKGFYAFDGKVVTVNYVDANDNDRDAFYHYEPNFDPTDPRTTTFTLYRPFAQLNAAVVNSDIEAVAKNGVALETSTVEVTTYTQFNLATGDVVESSETEVNFTATDMPYEASETLKSGYTYLSMNYILAPKAGSVSDVTFTFNNNKNINFGATYTNVPLKQNFRTNILGALLTAPTQFTVEIEEEFATAENTIFTAFEQGGEVTLTEDIEIARPLVVKSGVEAVLNLNGKTIKNNVDNNPSQSRRIRVDPAAAGSHPRAVRRRILHHDARRRDPQYPRRRAHDGLFRDDVRRARKAQRTVPALAGRQSGTGPETG